ncbi:hypothetical protein SO802_008195 [Lithocarpus litseifolius]|uniref:Clu domain-containing protein n=1 Tax=Lithocarpus litseifolius TaxID=425828 RepID=A0AAW2D7Y1_9ROSI
MAGKSNKGKNRRGSHNTTNSSESVVSSDAPAKDNLSASECTKADANGVPTVDVTTNAVPEVKESESENAAGQQKQGEGDIHLYPVSVKTQSGEKLELQLNPGDSVMDIRQFLLDAPETCYFTCYDLLLHTKDGSTHHLEDFNEISEVADITTGGCSLEMVPALYDDRSIRAHVHRTRELLSLSTLHASLSTSLALQYETTQNKASSPGDTAKTEVPELDGLGFMEDVAGSLNNLLSSSSTEIKCVESIVFSSFNPPPSYRRLVGDLIYLDVVTLEGNKFCMTGATKMFYVNSSPGNSLDPRPSKTSSEATTLVGLLQKISSKFKKAFREILERRASAHPFENVQSLLPPNSWLGSYPVPEHKRDAARAEDALTLSYGSELIGMQRDWNEELQSCREFPHTTPQERILRDRALYKVTSDFVDAAISGAIGVISRCIPPINPTDPECFHMYVHNNIFFSFAVDADLEQLSKKHSLNANSNIENSSLSNSSSDKASSLLHGDSGIPNGEKCEPKITGEGDNVVEVPSNVSAETQLTESEQATYASANNDLKGTKAYQEADVSGLYNLAMAIIDYRGHRVVAQVLEAAKRLHLKEHTVLDGSGNFFKLAAPVECKGIVGSDDRHYLLDLMRDQGGHQSSGKPSKGQGRFKGGALTRKNQLSFMNVSSETLWSDIQEFAKLKYQFELPEDARSRVKKVSVIRNLCQKAHPDLIQAFQAAATAGGSGSSGTSVNKSLNAAIIGDNPPRGRGVDERAARAAAEVRKKAAARGLLIRPHGVPVQAMPPLTQLLNIINSGMTPDAAEGGETDGVKKEANGHPSNGPVDSKNDELTSGQEDQAPVGLGTGLASLDAKKQKAKAKAAA